MTHDLVIAGGLVVDGTGAAGRVADVAVTDGRVVAVTDPGRGEPGRRRVDAEGLVVAPGFIDIHTHYDAQLFWDATASPSPLHGVTTIFGGNCGFTLFPVEPDDADFLTRMLARVEGMPLEALQAALDWRWAGFEDWARRLDGNTAVNAGFLVGHSALRRAAMGDDATGCEADPRQVERMTEMLGTALAAGAMGLSSSRAPTHHDGDGEPVPSRSAAPAELLALAAEVGRHAGTTLEMVLAGSLGRFDDDEIDLMASMSLASDRPLNWNVLGVSGMDPEGWRRQLGASDAAAARGATVKALTMPHLMRIRLSFLSGFVLDGFPGWREVMARPVPDRIRALSDPATRRRLDARARSDEAGLLKHLANWKILEIAETFSPQNEGLTGRTIADILAERGGDPFDVLCDIVCADELRTGLRPPAMGDSPADWSERAEAWHDPRTVVGASDAGAHLDMMCGAVYSTSLLGDAVRDRRLLTLEEAVRQLTSVPAALYGVRDRGVLRPGAWADVVVFDRDRIAPGPEHTRDDLPGGASRLYAEADGIEQVIVNGTPIVDTGAFTGDTPGRFLRSGRDTFTVGAAPG